VRKTGGHSCLFFQGGRGQEAYTVVWFWKRKKRLRRRKEPKQPKGGATCAESMKRRGDEMRASSIIYQKKETRRRDKRQKEEKGTRLWGGEGDNSCRKTKSADTSRFSSFCQEIEMFERKGRMILGVDVSKRDLGSRARILLSSLRKRTRFSHAEGMGLEGLMFVRKARTALACSLFVIGGGVCPCLGGVLEGRKSGFLLSKGRRKKKGKKISLKLVWSKRFDETWVGGGGGAAEEKVSSSYKGHTLLSTGGSSQRGPEEKKGRGEGSDQRKERTVRPREEERPNKCKP